MGTNNDNLSAYVGVNIYCLHINARVLLSTIGVPTNNTKTTYQRHKYK